MSKLQHHRLSKKLTQKQLSELSNIPLRTIQQWECQQRNIDGASLENLCNLSAALNCKIYDILESEDMIEKIKKII